MRHGSSLRRLVPAGISIALLATTLAAPATDTGARSVLVVPIVLSSGGAAGSYYTSELVLTNRGTTTASLELCYTAAFGEGSGATTDSLAPGQQKVVPDAIAWLRELGVPIPEGAGRGGTLQVVVSGLSSPDAAAITARTTTSTAAPQPVGAAGLAYPALPAATGFTTKAAIYGLRATTDDRSNVAIYNPSSATATVRVTAFSGDGSGTRVVKDDALGLAPLEWVQLSSVFDGTGISNGWVTIERTDGEGSFGAYGVINDNGTSDGSFVFPVGSAFAGTVVTVPVLVETTSGYSSELVLANGSDSAASLTLSYVESLTPTGGPGGSIPVELAPRSQLVLPEALDWLRGKGLSIGPRGAASYAGCLRVTASGPIPQDLFAGARTASRSPYRGQFGLFTPGVNEGQEASTEAFLYGLRADALNRSNVAVLNAGPDAGGPVKLELQAFDGDAGGIPRGAPDQITLDPGGWAQASAFLGSKGVANGWVRVMRLSGTAPWIAYATVNDGGNPGERTGDGAYVPMATPSISPQQPLEILVVAGGAGGGSAGDQAGGGGGGGGGVVHLAGGSWPTSEMSVRVGRGGGSNTSGESSAVSGGGYDMVAAGGGTGGRDYSKNAYGRSGGSGGGGGTDSQGRQTGGPGTQPGTTQTYPAGTLRQYGNSGGRGSFDPDGCGGGGGASTPGADGSRDLDGKGVGGAGDDGVLLEIGGSPTLYGAGGGGSGPGKYNSGRGGPGGAGGGGAGSQDSDAGAATGWGGGGGGAGKSKAGGNGYQGIVVIRYPGEKRATGGTVTSAGGFTIHTFTADGRFSF